MNGKILVVDDEKEIRHVVVRYLQAEHFQVSEAETGVEAVKKFQDEQPDLVVLDLMLPDIPGEKVCSVIRQSKDTPILMLTAKTAVDDRITGLTLGADDYMVKPFSPRELVIRVKNILRRTTTVRQEPAAQEAFPLTVDEASYTVKKNGRNISLTPIEFKLLLALYKNPERIFTREQLISSALGYEYEGLDRTMDSHIKNLRQKIEDNPNRPRFIRTVFGVGYKFSKEDD
ncbi:MAG: response regulator transcription factor [Clostridia bacterium]